MTEKRAELTRTTLGVLFILALMAGSAWLLSPFLSAFVWATMIVVATWPLMLALQRRFGGRRGPAVTVMVVAMLAVFFLPIGLAAYAMVTRVDDVAALAGLLSGLQLPTAPPWLAKAPFVGERLVASWNEIAAGGPEELVARLQPYLRSLGGWFVAHAGTVAGLLVQFLITTIFTAVLYSGGEGWAAWVRGFARRLAGERGDRIADPRSAGDPWRRARRGRDGAAADDPGRHRRRRRRRAVRGRSDRDHVPAVHRPDRPISGADRRDGLGLDAFRRRGGHDHAGLFAGRRADGQLRAARS